MNVRKRDGALEQFELGKVRRTLRLAFGSMTPPTALVNQLADAVQWFFADHLHAEEVDSADVFEVCLRVLSDTDHPKQARRLRRFAARRDRRREVLRVVRLTDGEPGDAKPFEKKFVVAHLRHVFSLGEPVAKLIASNVESEVVRSNYETVTTAYLQELMKMELLAWGLTPTVDAPVVGKKPAGSTQQRVPNKAR